LAKHTYSYVKPQARRINIEHFINLLPFIWRNYEDDESALPEKQ